MSQENVPIINVHTHLFSKNNTPKYLAKKIFPAPLHLLVNIPTAVKFINNILKGKQHKYSFTSKSREWRRYLSYMTIQRNIVLKCLLGGLFIWVVLHFVYYAIELFLHWTGADNWVIKIISWYRDSFDPIIFNEFNDWIKLPILVVLFFLFRPIRKGTKKTLHWIIKSQVGPDQIEYLARYGSLVRLSSPEKIGNTLNFLEQQYPKDSKFVVLPMDMTYMKAGPIQEGYLKQMDRLIKLKRANPKVVYPFIFVDPRRIKQQSENEPFFKWRHAGDGIVELLDCKIKTYLKHCYGIKIYPALGYYPFDPYLLPLWKYCADNQIPITTHCTVGPIYYRGLKLKEWDKHPVLLQQIGTDTEAGKIKDNIRLMARKNKDFQIYFTHPMNYFCLLSEKWLRKLIIKYQDPALNDLFGFSHTDIPLNHNLHHLKINLAHYGGAEEWDKFLSRDRFAEANYIINRPDKILDLIREADNDYFLEKCWKSVDWFSIISTLMLQYPNIYADLSYTSHDTKYLSLLKLILKNPGLRERVLFGTDFYVVSNHKTEKQYYLDMMEALDVEDWKQISFLNPKMFLNML